MASEPKAFERAVRVETRYDLDWHDNRVRVTTPGGDRLYCDEPEWFKEYDCDHPSHLKPVREAIAEMYEDARRNPDEPSEQIEGHRPANPCAPNPHSSASLGAALRRLDVSPAPSDCPFDDRLVVAWWHKAHDATKNQALENGADQSAVTLLEYLNHGPWENLQWRLQISEDAEELEELIRRELSAAREMREVLSALPKCPLCGEPADNGACAPDCRLARLIGGGE